MKKVVDFRINELLFIFYIFIIPICFWTQPALYIYPKILATNVVVISLFVLSMIYRIKKLKLKFSLNFIDLMIIVFFLYQGTSLLWAENYYLGLEFLSYETTFLLLYFYVKNFLSLDKIKKTIFIAVVLSSILVSIYGILQHNNFDFFSDFRPEKFKSIVLSTFGNKNFLSQYLIFTLIAHFIVLSFYRNWKIYFGLFISVLLNGFVLLMTLSKTAYLSLFGMVFIALAFFLILFKKQRKLFLNKKNLFITSILIFAIIIFYSVSFFIPYKVEPQSYYKNFESVKKFEKTKFDQRQNLQAAINNQFKLVYYKMMEIKNFRHEKILVRWNLILYTLKIIKDNVIFGVGINNWQIHYQKYDTLENQVLVSHLAREGSMALSAHNEYIQALAEYGLIGFLLLLTLISALCYYQIKNMIIEKNDAELVFQILIFTYFFGCLIQAFSSFLLHNPYPLLTILLVSAYISNSSETKKIVKIFYPKENSIHRIVIYMILFLGLFFSISIYFQNYKYLKRNYFSALGQFYHNFKNYKNKMVAYKNAYYYTPNDYQTTLHTAQSLIDYAIYLKKQNDTVSIKQYFNEAIEFLKKSIRLHPYIPRAHYKLGSVYYELAQINSQESLLYYKKAGKSYLNAIEIFPEYANAYTNLGNVFVEIGILFQQKDPKQSIRYFNEALKKHLKAYELFKKSNLSLADPTLLKSLGLDYYYLGEFQKSNNFFYEYLKVVPNSSDKNQILKVIEFNLSKLK